MEDLMFFLITFVFIFGVLLINYYYRKRKGTLNLSKEFSFLKIKFKLTKKDLQIDKLGLIFVLINSLIISSTATITTMIDMDYVWQIAIGFLILVFEIYLIYGLVGKILMKRRNK